MLDFIQKNTDKLLVMLVLFVFYWGAWWGFHRENPNFATGSLDLVKQLAAAFLTLTVSSRMGTRVSDNGGTNGKATTITTVVPPSASASVVAPTSSGVQH